MQFAFSYASDINTVMLHGVNLNWERIVKYSAVLFVVPIMVSAFIHTVLSLLGLELYSALASLFVNYILLSVFSIAVYAHLVRYQLLHPILHVLIVGFSVHLFGFITISMLMGRIHISQLWLLDISVFVITLILGTVIGTQLRKDIE